MEKNFSELNRECNKKNLIKLIGRPTKGTKKNGSASLIQFKLVSEELCCDL